jgi:hypothetical protein
LQYWPRRESSRALPSQAALLHTHPTSARLRRVLGHPGTTYSTSPDQGAERWYGDTVTKTADGKGVNLTFSVYNTSDAVRIITLAP